VAPALSRSTTAPSDVPNRRHDNNDDDRKDRELPARDGRAEQGYGKHAYLLLVVDA
jgi:hypothetical protein